MGRIDFFRGILLLSLLLLLPTPGIAQFSGSASISLNATVYSETGKHRIPRASAALCTAGGNTLQETISSESGDFSFGGIRPGHYILRVRAAGYDSAELPVDLSLASQRGLSVFLKTAQAAVPPVAPGAQTISAHELAMPEQARALLVSGKKKLYAGKNAPAALRDFQAATAMAHAYYEAHYFTGMAYLALQNPAEAEKQFRKSVDISRKMCADADIALGTLLLQRKELQEGEALLRQGLAINPQSWPGQFALGELELSRGRMEQALAAAEKAESLAPQQPVVYRLLAMIHLREKNFAALLTDLDSYLELDPDSPAGVRARELRVEAVRQLAQSQDAAVSADK